MVYYRPGARGAAFELLQKGASGPNDAANYSLKSIDVTGPERKALAEQRQIAAYPWAEVYYPVHCQVRTPVWSGPLTSARARKILNSNMRSRLKQALLGGDVAVWILITSGHEQKDRAALASLETSVNRASATLRIPDIGTDLNGNPIDVPDFKTYPVRFTVLEIARDDPREDLLVSALLKSEPDLEQYDEPIAFPVFGRGRALYALVGKGIQEKNILEACKSMLAWCSCEIKAQSPGTDLLIAADWSRPFGGRMVKDPELPLTGLSKFIEAQKPAETAAPRWAPGPVQPAIVCRRVPSMAGADPIPTPVQPPGRSPLMRNVFYLAVVMAVVVLAASVFLTTRGKR